MSFKSLNLFIIFLEVAHMHVELSLDAQDKSVEQNEERSHSEDTQRISGSQVVCAFASIEQDKAQQSNQSRFQVLALSMAAVFTVVAVYLVFVLAL
jgi:hypothetical protein